MSKVDFTAEAVRIGAEYEAALDALVAAEQSHQLAIHKIAGRVVLSEITVEEAREQRQALEADLAAKREQVATLKDALPELERRRVEEEQHARQLAITRSSEKLAKTSQAKFNAVKNFAKALRETGNLGAEVLRHRGLEAEAAAGHRELVGEDFEWPKTADEEWSLAEEIVALIVGGAFQPIANAAREAEKKAQDRARQDDESLAWFERSPTALNKTQLPEHLRSHPRIAAAEKEWDARAAAQKAARRVPREEREEEQAEKLVEV